MGSWNSLTYTWCNYDVMKCDAMGRGEARRELSAVAHSIDTETLKCWNPLLEAFSKVPT